MKKLLALILASMMLLAVLVSCGKQLDDPADTTESTTDGAEDVTDAEDNESETRSTEYEVPDDLKFGGAKYKILSRQSTAYEFDETVVGGSGGDTVVEAIAKRNAYVEDYHDVEIEVQTEKGDWGNKDTFTKRVQSEVSSGYTETALVATHSNYLAQIATSGYGQDMNNLDYVNYEKEWWSEAIYNDCAIDGRCYFMIGDITYSVYERMEVMYFNKTALEPYCDDLYALVEDNAWTYDQMITWAKQHSPNQGTGEPDVYGLSLNSHSVKALLTAMEVEFTYVDGATGRHQMYAKGELPDLVNTKIMNLVKDIYTESGIRWYKEGTSTDEAFSTPKFAEGKILFYGAELQQATGIAGTIKDQWGIVPFPLYDEGQEQYYTGGRDEMSAVMVLKNYSKQTMAGAVTETMAYQSYQLVRPAYYDTVVKGQLAQDAKTVKMLDFIRGNYKMPFGLAYTTVLGNPYFDVEICYDEGGNEQYNTKYDTHAESYASKLQEMYDGLDAQ